RLLSVGREQAFGGEHLLESLQPSQQLADPAVAKVARAQRAPAAVEVELWPTEDHGPTPGFNGWDDAGDEIGRAAHSDRHVGRGIAEREEDHRAPVSMAELGDLTLDPHRTQLVHPLTDQTADRPDRYGLLGRRI